MLDKKLYFTGVKERTLRKYAKIKLAMMWSGVMYFFFSAIIYIFCNMIK